MSNATTTEVSQGCSLSDHPHTMTVNQGDRVNLRGDDQKSVDNDTSQVIGVDEEHDRCWVRRWPLEPKVGSPVFEISFNQISTIGC